jgi:xanthine dehydrogenase YagS FAD-binding subunit
MTVTSYDRPGSIGEAIQSQASDTGGQHAYIGGGTELVPLIRAGIADPRHLVDLRLALPAAIEHHAGGRLTIGAGTTMSAVASDPFVREQYPLLAQALLASASPQIRNVATIGGNLLQRTRCSYFRDTAFACNKRIAGSGCPPQESHNRSHAILGGSPSCVAVHASDLAVALTALDARLRLRGPDGERDVPLATFYLDPGDTPWRETVLTDRELVIEVECPAPATSSAYVKVRDRASFEFAVVSAAALVRIDGGVIAAIAIALGGVAPRPCRLALAERALTGQPLTRAAVGAAIRASLADARPLSGNAFKVDLARRTAERAVTAAGGIA